MHKKLFSLLAVFSAILTLLNGVAFAIEEEQPCWQDLFCPEGHRLEDSLYAGYLNIASQELVLSDGSLKTSRLISKMDWTANNVWIIGAKWNFYIPAIATKISLDGWSKVFAGGAHLEDRDYLDFDHPGHRTHLSVHEKTKLQTAIGLDLEYCTDLLYALHAPHIWKIGLLYGVRYTRFDWKAYGGDYFYEEYYPFTLPSSLKVIGYRQEALVPYLGLQGIWKYNEKLSFKGFTKYSPLTMVKAKDYHYLRFRTFDDWFRNGIYWVFGAEAAWNYTQNIKGYIRYSCDRLERTRGCASVYKYGEYRGTFKDAGIEYTYQMLTIGVSAFF